MTLADCVICLRSTSCFLPTIRVVTALCIFKGWENVKPRPGVCWMAVLRRASLSCPCSCVWPHSKAAKDVMTHSERISASFLSILPDLRCSSAPRLLARFLPHFLFITLYFQLCYHHQYAFFFSPPPSCYRVLDISEQVMRNNLHLCRHVGSDLFLWLASLWILVLVAHCAWEWLLCFHSFKCWINNSKTCTSLNNEDCSSNWVNPLLALTAFTRLLSYGES